MPHFPGWGDDDRVGGVHTLVCHLIPSKIWIWETPLLVSWQNPILLSSRYLPDTIEDWWNSVATCFLSARGPPLFEDSADHSGMGLRNEKNQAGSPPPPESQGPWSPCAEGAGSSPGGKGLEKCVWGEGSHPGQTWLEMISKSPLSHSPSVFVFWDNYFRKLK